MSIFSQTEVTQQNYLIMLSTIWKWKQIRFRSINRIGNFIKISAWSRRFLSIVYNPWNRIKIRFFDNDEVKFKNVPQNSPRWSAYVLPVNLIYKSLLHLENSGRSGARPFKVMLAAFLSSRAVLSKSFYCTFLNK